MINVLDLARKIVSYLKEDTSTLKLQKLCYYCQAWYYTFYGKPLVPEVFVALERGPDCRDVHSLYPVDGSNALKYDNTEYHLNNDNDDAFVDGILDVYGKFDGEMLSNFTHTETPWIKAWGLTVYKKESQVIPLKDMRECYFDHSFYDIFAVRFLDGFIYKKYVLSNNRIVVEEMKKQEKQTLQAIVHSLNLSENDETEVFVEEFEGELYVFFKADCNILLLTNPVQEYIMNNTKKIEEVKKMIDNKKLTYFWQYNESQEIYAYTSPELGIMVNEKTFADAVDSVVKTLKHLEKHYKTATINEADKLEKECIEKVYSIYKYDKQQFYSLLGLSKENQLQGELINVN